MQTKAKIKIIWLKPWKAAYQPKNEEGKKYLMNFLRLPELPNVYSYYWR